MNQSLETILLSMIGPGIALAIMALQERRREARIDHMLPSPQSTVKLRKLRLVQHAHPRPELYVPESDCPVVFYPPSLARVFPITVPPEIPETARRRRPLGKRIA